MRALFGSIPSSGRRKRRVVSRRGSGDSALSVEGRILGVEGTKASEVAAMV
jgi:hypothetical protein